MQIFDRYIMRETARYFGFVLAMVVIVYISVDFFEKLDNFIEAGISVDRMLFFYILMIPKMVSQVMPVGGLLSVLIVFGLMNRNNETVALMSSGISTFKLVRPVVVMGLIATMVLFIIAEVFVPLTTERANRFWLEEVKPEKLALITRERDVWVKDNDAIIHFRHYSPKRKTSEGLSANYFDKKFALTRRIDASEAIYTQNGWLLRDVMEQVYNPSNDHFEVKFHKKMIEKFQVVTEDLRQVMKTSDEMNLLELGRYVKRVEMEGYDATSFKVDFQAKISFPLICLITGLLAVGISLYSHMPLSLPVSISYGVVISFCYWIFHSFSMSLGYGGLLPPLFSAWIANFVFSALAAILLLSAK